MREARQRQRFFETSDVATNPDISACRAAIKNIAAARELAPRRGRPLDIDQLLAALDAIEKAKVPLLDYKDGPAVKVIAARLNADRIEAGKAKPTKAAAHSILRRLLDLRNRLR